MKLTFETPSPLLAGLLGAAVATLTFLVLPHVVPGFGASGPAPREVVVDLSRPPQDDGAAAAVAFAIEGTGVVSSLGMKLATGRTTFTLKKGRRLSDADILAAVRSVGADVDRIIRRYGPESGAADTAAADSGADTSGRTRPRSGVGPAAVFDSFPSGG